MRRSFALLVACLAVALFAFPAFAGVDFKYGGLFTVRMQSNDNVVDGDDDLDDNQNYIDQRLRMFFTFVASERLQVVTKWEADTIWGNQTGGRHGGGGIDADEVNLEMKNAYVDFLIPQTPVRATLGVQGIALMTGWIVDADFSAAVLSTKMEPITINAGYAAAKNEDVTDESENIDAYMLSLDYAGGPFSAALIGYYQYGHDRNLAPGDDQAFLAIPGIEDDHFIDVGLSLGYKLDWMSAFVNGVKNLGGFDLVGGGDGDYEGWMVEAGVNFFVNTFTFTLGGFYTTGDDDLDDDDQENFAYPAGASHYWSEIMGLGTLDTSVGEPGADDRVRNNGAYGTGDTPSNLWTVSAGVAWQALPATKLTANYYYIRTTEDVASDTTGGEDDTIGHEVDLYIDQEVVDGLQLRLVGAYLFADDAYTLNADDDDAYELGAQLLWAF